MASNGMTQGDTARGRGDLLRMNPSVQPVDLELLADACEALDVAGQRWGLAQVLHLLGASAPGAIAPPWSIDGNQPQHDAMWIGLLADSGAFESAALALLPDRAAYTCGRFADGSHVAQVVLPGGVGAHSRGAQSLSMAIAAALLRALGRDLP